MKCWLLGSLTTLTLGLPTWAWAQQEPAQTPPPPAVPEAEETGVEDAALRMLRLRLEACEQEARPACLPPTTSPPTTPAPTLHAHAAVWGTRLGYTNAWALSGVSALTARVGIDGTNWGGWLATGLSQTGLRYAKTDFHQSTHLASGWWQGRTLHLDATLGQLGTNAQATDGTWLASLHGLWLPGALGADLSVFATRYPSRDVFQIDPQAVLVLSPQFEAALGGQLIAFDNATRMSVRAGVTWRPHPLVELGLSGWAGQRQYAIEAGGLSVWSNDDVYKAGYRAALSWQFLPSLALDASWLQDFGTAQHNQWHSYQLLGGTLGVRARF